LGFSQCFTAATDSPTIALTAAPIAPGSPTFAPVVATSGPSVASVPSGTDEPTDASTMSVTSAGPAPGATGAPTVTPASGATSAPTATPAAGATGSPTPTPALGATGAPTSAPAAGATGAPAAATTVPGISSAPSTAATNTATAPTGTTRRVQNYWIAYGSPGATEPSQEEYDAVFNNTASYFDTYFKEYWAADPNVEFLNVTTTAGETAFEVSGKPPSGGGKLNIYMAYNFSDFNFAPGSDIPSSSEIFTAMKGGINVDYVVSNVIPVGGPFATVNQAAFGAQDVAAPSPSP
jgi:hypothetical protein